MTTDLSAARSALSELLAATSTPAGLCIDDEGVLHAEQGCSVVRNTTIAAAAVGDVVFAGASCDQYAGPIHTCTAWDADICLSYGWLREPPAGDAAPAPPTPQQPSAPSAETDRPTPQIKPMADPTPPTTSAYRHFTALLETTPVATCLVVDDSGRVHAASGCSLVEETATTPPSVATYLSQIEGVCGRCHAQLEGYVGWLDWIAFADTRLAGAHGEIRRGRDWMSETAAAELFALRSTVGAAAGADTALAQAALTAAVGFRNAAWADKTHPRHIGWGLAFGIDYARAIGPRSPKIGGTAPNLVFAYPRYDTLAPDAPALDTWDVPLDRFDDRWFAAVADAAAGIATSKGLGMRGPSVIAAAAATVG